MSTVHVTMNAFAAALLCLVISGCTTPSLSPVLGSLTPSPSITLSCPGFPAGSTGSPPASPTLDCPYVESIVLAAVTDLGYPVRSVTILLGDFCGGPFPSGFYACPTVIDLASAYVSFVGTDKVAALLIRSEGVGSTFVAKVFAFEVPPAGWSMP